MGNLMKSCNASSATGNRSLSSTFLSKTDNKQTTENIINDNNMESVQIGPKQAAAIDLLLSQSLTSDNDLIIHNNVEVKVNDGITQLQSNNSAVTADSDLLNFVNMSSTIDDVHVTYQSSVKQVYHRRKSTTTAMTGSIPSVDLPRIKLLPHEHTLFCERKQRVCTAVGKLQEMEVLKIDGYNLIPKDFSWIRIHPIVVQGDDEEVMDRGETAVVRCHSIDTILHDNGLYNVIVGSENSEQYVLTREDVGYFIGICYQIPLSSSSTTSSSLQSSVSSDTTISTATNTSKNSITTCIADADSQSILLRNDTDSSIDTLPPLPLSTTKQFLVSEEYGVVQPGPPRLLEFTIEGTMEVGSYAVAKVDYIGGFEGASEYWWMRIGADGRRTQVTEPSKIAVHPSTGKCLPSSVDDNPFSKDGDPRYYKLNEADKGCFLKAKCRPTRTDGVQGEIFTSKSSLVVP